MSKYITCIDDFQNTLREVDVILEYARFNQKDRYRYNTFIKSALILLVSKFEAFLEDTISDYIQAVKNIGLKPKDLPEVLKIHTLDKIIDDTFISNVRKHSPKALRTIEEMAKICIGNEIILTIDIDTKFDYGRHGEKAMNKLFSRIGINDIFEQCRISEKRESLSSNVKLSVPVDIAADINALTNIRNNILHGDATPSLTHEQIENYQNHIVLFSLKLVDVLDDSVNNIKP